MSVQLNANDFWQFSIRLYEQQPVQQLLLDAQDQFGVNVNLALFCAWLNQHTLYLSLQQFADIESVLSPFNTQCTQPLRLSRLNLKQFQTQLDNYSQLKTSLLTAELELEKIEQQLIVSTFNNPNQSISQLPKQGDNLSLYQQYINTRNNKTRLCNLSLTDLNQYLN